MIFVVTPRILTKKRPEKIQFGDLSSTGITPGRAINQQVHALGKRTREQNARARGSTDKRDACARPRGRERRVRARQRMRRTWRCAGQTPSIWHRDRRIHGKGEPV